MDMLGSVFVNTVDTVSRVVFINKLFDLTGI